MRKYWFKFDRRHMLYPQRQSAPLPTLLFLISTFLIGSVLGSFVGCGAEAGAEEIAGLLSGTEAGSAAGFFRSLWKIGWYHLTVILAATSVLGVFVIPATTFLRGYFLSCTAAAAIVALPEKGVITALIVCGVSAVLTIPSLFLLSQDGFCLSRRLRALSSGKSVHYDDRNVLSHLCVTAVCLLTAAGVDCVLVPWLLSHLL